MDSMHPSVSPELQDSALLKSTRNINSVFKIEQSGILIKSYRFGISTLIDTGNSIVSIEPPNKLLGNGGPLILTRVGGKSKLSTSALESVEEEIVGQEGRNRNEFM